MLIYITFQLSLEPNFQGTFSWDRDAALSAKFDAWLLHLPQVLWELGNNNLLTTEASLI